MQIKIINKSNHALPHYETIVSAGMDLRANIEDAITLKPLDRTIVKTGLFIDISVVSLLGMIIAWYFLRYFK